MYQCFMHEVIKQIESEVGNGVILEWIPNLYGLTLIFLAGIKTTIEELHEIRNTPLIHFQCKCVTLVVR